MKNLFFTLIMLTGLSLTFQSCEPQIQKNDQFISLEVKNLRGSDYVADSIIRVMYSQDGNWVNDTLQKINGRFVFNKSVSIPEGEYLEARLYFPNDELIKWVGPDKRGYYPSSASYMKVFMYKGLDVEGVVNIDNEKGFLTYDITTEVSNSINKDFSEYSKVYNPAANDAVNQRVVLSAFPRETVKEDSAKYAAASEVSEELNKKAEAVQYEFAKNNLDKEAGAVVVAQLMRGIKVNELESEYFNKMTPSVQSSFYGKAVKKQIDALRSTEIGATVSEVEGKTFKGEDFKLSDLRGKKVVIIDFWGTWCGPCVGGMPHMLEAYKKYDGKLEILGLANDRKASWEKFLEKSDYQWVHILDEGNKFVSQFAVNAFPTKFIIGIDGKILHKEVGEGPEFYTKLDEIMADVK